MLTKRPRFLHFCGDKWWSRTGCTMGHRPGTITVTAETRARLRPQKAHAVGRDGPEWSGEASDRDRWGEKLGVRRTDSSLNVRACGRRWDIEPESGEREVETPDYTSGYEQPPLLFFFFSFLNSWHDSESEYVKDLKPSSIAVLFCWYHAPHHHSLLTFLYSASLCKRNNGSISDSACVGGGMEIKWTKRRKKTCCKQETESWRVHQ